MAFRCLPLEVGKLFKHLQKTYIFKKSTSSIKGAQFSYTMPGITLGEKSFYSEAVTRNLELLSNEKLILETKSGRLPTIKIEKNRPLAVLFEWISADKNHLYKYADLYLERGYDVLSVSLSVRQLLWPLSGSQVVAGEALEFLYQNPVYNPLLVHGFSIGGYVWGETLVLMVQNLPKYQPVIDRIKGQVWDSTPDVTEFHKGFPKALFPNNALFRMAVEKSIVCHLRIFHDKATKYYINSSKMFHETPVKAPALMFIAKNDPIASYKSITKVKEYWETRGIKTYLKSWDKSKHVSHLRLHKEDYIKSLADFISNLNENKNQDKEISEKIHAKL